MPEDGLRRLSVLTARWRPTNRGCHSLRLLGAVWGLLWSPTRQGLTPASDSSTAASLHHPSWERRGVPTWSHCSRLWKSALSHSMHQGTCRRQMRALFPDPSNVSQNRRCLGVTSEHARCSHSSHGREQFPNVPGRGRPLAADYAPPCPRARPNSWPPPDPWGASSPTRLTPAWKLGLCPQFLSNQTHLFSPIPPTTKGLHQAQASPEKTLPFRIMLETRSPLSPTRHGRVGS